MIADFGGLVFLTVATGLFLFLVGEPVYMKWKNRGRHE